MYLFLAQYPTEHTIKEGMSQRIIHIDNFYKDEQRVYLSVLLFRNFVKKKHNIDDKIICYQCNTFLHFFTILSLFIKSKKIYIHSLYNVLPNIFYIWFFGKDLVLDIHGVVPEENKLIGQNFRFIVFNWCEKLIFHKKNIKVICVTNQMINFYQRKYQNTTAHFVRYIIFPNNLQDNELTYNHSDKVNIIYSGNLQKWQNIDLMIETIKKIHQNPNYHFYILTGELEAMKRKFKNVFGDSDKITITSLPPDKLASIYNISHYGFVLRDDIEVNNVACPTKLIEYMNYGIVPIVLGDSIGDFKEYDYERVLNTELENLKPYKSLKNKEIINKINKENSLINIKEL